MVTILNWNKLTTYFNNRLKNTQFYFIMPKYGTFTPKTFIRFELSTFEV